MNTQIGAQARITRIQIITFLSCWLGGIFAGMDANLFSLMLPQLLPEILHTLDRTMISHAGSYVLFLFLIGWMLGGICFGVIGDRFGRVKSLALALAFCTIFTGLIGLSSQPWHLLVCRFFVGVGVGGTMLSMAILLSETWPAHLRAMAIGAGITSYQAGVFLSGFAAHFFSEWRTLFACGAIPLLLAFFLPFFLKEPETWKVAQTQLKNKISLTTHMKTLFHSQYRFSLFIGSATFGSLLIGYWASLSWVPVWIQDLVGASDGHEKSLATMYHALAAMTGCLLTGFLANSWGRVPVILFSLIGAFLISVWMFLSNSTFSSIIYFQHTALGLFAGMAQSIMYIYLPELFPTHIRASAVGFCLNCGRIVTAILVLFVGALVTFFDGYAPALCAFSIMYLIGVVAVSFGKKQEFVLDRG